MKNLAGDPLCDIYILKELEAAGIASYPLRDPGNTEVPYTVIGGLGEKPLTQKDRDFVANNGIYIETVEFFNPFIFTRAWYYWCVSGYVPLHVAEEMYEYPIGKKDIRANGHCGCPPPSEQVVQHKVCGMKVVDSYHIDSQEGLNLFVQTMKKHGLV